MDGRADSGRAGEGWMGGQAGGWVGRRVDGRGFDFGLEDGDGVVEDD